MNMRKLIFFGALAALIVSAAFLTTQQAKGCNEGCTPGFWKTHLSVPPWPTAVCNANFGDGWHWLSSQPCPESMSILLYADQPWNTPVTTVFDVACLDDEGRLDLNGDGVDDTLLDALNYQGGEGLNGKAQILLRIAVADVLNGMTQDHDPPGATIDHVYASLAGFMWNGWQVPGACTTGNLGMVEYWSEFLDDRANSQPCAFDLDQ